MKSKRKPRGRPKTNKQQKSRRYKNRSKRMRGGMEGKRRKRSRGRGHLEQSEMLTLYQKAYKKINPVHGDNINTTECACGDKINIHLMRCDRRARSQDGTLGIYKWCKECDKFKSAKNFTKHERECPFPKAAKGSAAKGSAAKGSAAKGSAAVEGSRAAAREMTLDELLTKGAAAVPPVRLSAVSHKDLEEYEKLETKDFEDDLSEQNISLLPSPRMYSKRGRMRRPTKKT